MTTPIDIPAHERGVVRVFALSMTDAEARTLSENPNAIAEALGVDTPLDANHLELFPITDLEGVGLAGYLNEGAGVPLEALGRDRGKLDKLGGWVLVLFSLAFEDRATTLRPASNLTLIGTYGETRTDYSAEDTLTSEAAKPYTAPPDTVKKRPSDAAMSGRVAMLVLLLLALFTYVFIRMAG
ncbi:hypothetical protein [uncultured Tateyamaria sp.]|uniref:hypothetical protein n=1 Tax=Tateyamaria sp. 1078 TaxID=3417464 RepID=UPI002639326F|nr:hypothetical protein [uncultured Tateyamaria sp.]